MALASGTKLGPYEITAPLGAGGMGEVYRARDNRLGRDVAIKVLPRGFSQNGDRLRRFEQEARAAGILNHPNILSIYDIGTIAGAPYMVSELLEGQTLRETLRAMPLSPYKAIEVGIQIANGLGAAHEKGIVHRDLKPENLFLTKDGRVKILDFGLAKLIEHDEIPSTDNTLTLLTEPGIVLGTLGYMSPEQVRGKPADQRSDLFSLGAVLFEMISGHRAFPGDTPADAMSAILKEDPPEMARAGSAVSPVVDRIVRRCLEKDPNERFQSARDLGFALEAVAGTTGSIPAQAVRPKRSKLKRLSIWVIGFLVLVASYLVGHRAGVATTVQSPVFTPQTFQRGVVHTARFAPDGQTIVYSAEWGGDRSQLFMTRTDNVESRALEWKDSNLFAISNSGEMAVSAGCSYFFLFSCGGTLARVPLSGGALREVRANVRGADWSPEGKDLAVISEVGGRTRLEFPIGTVLAESSGWISSVRVSPGGEMVAYAEHPVQGDDEGSVVIVDRQGHRVTGTASGLLHSVEGLAWSPGGKEVWFAGDKSGAGWADELIALSTSGKLRDLLRLPGITRLHDIFRDGRVLLSKESFGIELFSGGSGLARESDLSWLDATSLSDMSTDGKTVVFEEGGDTESGSGFDLYLRRTDGTPPVKLGSGTNGVLSPDGQWVLAVSGTPDALILLPSGVGEPRTIDSHGIRSYLAPGWFADGKRIVFAGNEGNGWHMYVQEISSGKPTAVTPVINRPGTYENRPLSPDGRLIWARDPEAKGMALSS